MNPTTDPFAAPPPRLWPLVGILALQIAALIASITPEIQNAERFGFMMGGPALALLLFLIWLGLASRLTRPEKVAITFALVGVAVVAGFVVDPSMRTSLFVHGVPLALLLISVGLFLGRDRKPGARTRVAVGGACLGWALFALARAEGFDGNYRPELRWRWQPTAEELFAERDAPPPADLGDDAPPLVLGKNDWPGFRGPNRNGRAEGVVLRTDWDVEPPRELWRIPLGPGWSSFAHVAGRLYTQEQRGESEAVVCYDAETGGVVWTYEYPARFSDVVAGPGPRSTPTFADGRIYALGARATLVCVDAANGELVWIRDLMDELEAALPPWGFSGSPLVAAGVVSVYAGGRDDQGLVAYDAATGDPVWQASGAGMNFASAQVETISGIEIVLFTNQDGLQALDPASGKQLFIAQPSGWKGAPMVQPQRIGENSVVVALGDGIGVARVEIERAEYEWKVTETWSSPRLKPSFNDFVFHEGHLYGFDQSIFTCVDAATGAKKWRRGRYGFGQVLLLADSDALVVATEQGELVLLAADPTEHRELARMPAVDGKTWNHPIAVGDRLFVRNGQEAVAFAIARSSE